jgi:mono/diheme cytochrome c family protein
MEAHEPPTTIHHPGDMVNEMSSRGKRWFARLSVVAGAAAIAVSVLASAHAVHAQGQEPDPNDVAAGQRIFKQKADCQACHGWAADGRKMDSQMPDGANLRVTKLDRDKLIVAIKCGIPGKSMPAFDRLAYSDGRCYGLKEADLQRMKTTLPDPPATLQPREIEQVADFLFAKVIGKGPMDRAKCIEYWGSDVETCKEFAK